MEPFVAQAPSSSRRKTKTRLSAFPKVEHEGEDEDDDWSAEREYEQVVTANVNTVEGTSGSCSGRRDAVGEGVVAYVDSENGT